MSIYTCNSCDTSENGRCEHHAECPDRAAEVATLMLRYGLSFREVKHAFDEIVRWRDAPGD